MKKKLNQGLSLLLVMMMIANLFVTPSLATNNRPIEDGLYYIQSGIGNYSMVIDCEGAGTADGDNAILWGCNGGSNQRFLVSYHNGFYRLQFVHSKKLLDVEYASKEPCSNVSQCVSNGQQNQDWKIIPAGKDYYYIIARHSGLYLDVSGGEAYNGANLITYPGNQQANQKFKFVPISKVSGGGSIKFNKTTFALNVGQTNTVSFTFTGGVNSVNYSFTDDSISKCSTGGWDSNTKSGTLTFQGLNPGKTILTVDLYDKQGILLASQTANITVNSVPTSGYNRAAALAYAKTHWDNGKGLCAEYCSNVIKAGGVSGAWAVGCTTLDRQLTKLKGVTKTKLNVESNGCIKVSKNKDANITAGDLIILYCPGCLSVDGLPYTHVVCVSEAKDIVKVYAHNNAVNNQAYYGFNCCGYYGHGTRSDIIAYLYHFN